MEQGKFKCPQCGATNVEKIGFNQYSCPYCSHHFYVQNESVVEGNSTSKYQELRSNREDLIEEMMKSEKKDENKATIIYIIALIVLGAIVTYFSI